MFSSLFKWNVPAGCQLGAVFSATKSEMEGHLGWSPGVPNQPGQQWGLTSNCKQQNSWNPLLRYIQMKKKWFVRGGSSSGWRWKGHRENAESGQLGVAEEWSALGGDNVQVLPQSISTLGHWIFGTVTQPQNLIPLLLSYLLEVRPRPSHRERFAQVPYQEAGTVGRSFRSFLALRSQLL